MPEIYYIVFLFTINTIKPKVNFKYLLNVFILSLLYKYRVKA